MQRLIALVYLACSLTACADPEVSPLKARFTIDDVDYPIHTHRVEPWANEDSAGLRLSLGSEATEEDDIVYAHFELAAFPPSNLSINTMIDLGTASGPGFKVELFGYFATDFDCPKIIGPVRGSMFLTQLGDDVIEGSLFVGLDMTPQDDESYDDGCIKHTRLDVEVTELKAGIFGDTNF